MAPERNGSRGGRGGLRLADHLRIAVATGLLFGAVDATAHLPGGAPAFRIVLAGAGAASLAAAIVGAVQALAASVLGRLAAWLGAGDWIERCTTRAPSAPREPVIRLHAAVLAALATGAGLLWGLWLLLRRLSTVHDEKLVRRLVLVAVAGGVLAAAVAGVVLAALLAGPLRRLDRRVGLPWPASPALRYALYVALPAALAVVPTLWQHGPTLGPFALPFWLLLFVAAEGLVTGLARRPWSWLRKASRWSGLALAALWIALLALAHAGIASDRGAAADLQRGRLLSIVLPPLRALADVDRDGASALFGGADCAPFNSRIHPAARDEPGNGVDEDCDGADAADAPVSAAGPTYYDGLARERVRRYHVLWIIIDAVRADHASVLGYPKPTTPYMEALARESLVFTRAFSQSSATMLSIPSMLTGRDPGRMQWAQAHGRLQPAAAHIPLSERLGAAGYRTGIVATRYFAERIPGLLQGYQRVAYAARGQRESAASAAAHALAFIEDDPGLPAAGAPFFLTLYIASPHHPYVAHDEGYPQFGAGPMGLYDQEIAAADRYAGLVLDYLRHMEPLWDNTIVVISSDHGEEHGEHGGSQHARTCYAESVRVPLLLRVPGMEARRVDVPVALVDVAPALIELLGIERPADGELDGRSLLLSAFAPERIEADRPLFCSVLSQKAAQGHFFRRAVRMGRHMLAQELTGAGSEELYDTEADPAERRPLPASPEMEAVRERLRAALTRAMTGNLASQGLTEE